MMIISFDSGKVAASGTGLLQQKKVNITKNGLDVVIPDAGYDGLSTVYVNATIDNGTGMKDFSVIGYDEELNIQMNQGIDADIAHSKELYDAWNPENTSASSLYARDIQLVYAPAIDTSNVTNMGSMFNGCSSITKIDTISWNTSKCESFSNTFSNCVNLREVGDLDTSSATRIDSMFYNDKSLVTIPKISVKSMSNSCFTNIVSVGANLVGGTTTNVTTFKGIIDCEHLTNWGGTGSGSPFHNVPNLVNIQEMGVIKGAQFNLSTCTKLTVESLMVVINALYDYVGNGSSNTNTITLGSTNLAKLSDEQIAIATDKGWILIA